MRRMVTFWLAAAAGLTPFLPLPVARGAEPSYIGSKKCRACHIREHRAWEQSKMSKAFDILRPGERAEAKASHGLDPDKDYTTDPQCLACHTTGFGKPGGFVDMASTPDLAGVGCEMCHGPGGAYVADAYMSLKNKNYKKADLLAVGLTDVSAETCTGQCHNESNPTAPAEPFDYEKRKQDGVHEIYPLKYDHK